MEELWDTVSQKIIQQFNCCRRRRKGGPSLEHTYDACPMTGKTDGECPVSRLQAVGFANAKKEEGNTFFKNGKYLKAIEKYTEACKMVPSASTYFLNRAKAYSKLGKLKFAIKDAKRAIELDASNTKAYWTLASTYKEMKKTQDALGVIAEAWVMLDSNDPENYALLQLQNDLLGKPPLPPLKTIVKQVARAKEKQKNMFASAISGNDDRPTTVELPVIPSEHLNPEQQEVRKKQRKLIDECVENRLEVKQKAWDMVLGGKKDSLSSEQFMSKEERAKKVAENRRKLGLPPLEEKDKKEDKKKSTDDINNKNNTKGSLDDSTCEGESGTEKSSATESETQKPKTTEVTDTDKAAKPAAKQSTGPKLSSLKSPKNKPKVNLETGKRVEPSSAATTAPSEEAASSSSTGPAEDKNIAKPKTHRADFEGLSVRERAAILEFERHKEEREQKLRESKESAAAAAAKSKKELSPEMLEQIKKSFEEAGPVSESEEEEEEIITETGEKKKKPKAAYKMYDKNMEEDLSIKGGHKYMERPEHVELPERFKKPIGKLTVEELASYNCNNDSMMLCVFGDIFEVTDRPDKYGPDGPYWELTGSDITYGLSIGNDRPCMANKYYDLYKAPDPSKELIGMVGWLHHFQNEYGMPVGRLDKYDDECYHLPAPPLIVPESNGECSIQ